MLKNEIEKKVNEKKGKKNQVNPKTCGPGYETRITS